VSVVDQRAWLATGAVRRLLLRTVLVLGGAFAATVIGWLFCAGSANADVLPSVPTVPSVLSSVASDATAASAATHATAASVTHAAASVTSVTSDVAAVTPKKVAKAAVSSLSAVGKQAHTAVTQVTDRVAPSVLPATELVKHTDLVPLATRLVSTATQPVTKQLTTPDTKQVAATKAVTKAVTQATTKATPEVTPKQPVHQVPSRPFVVVQHRHVAQSAAPQSHATSGSPSPAGVGHHSPAMPPLQPAGSSNSSAHSGGGVAGGPGGAQVRFTHVLGAGLTMADTSSTPRIAAGPGRQPGTSPD
jgi:hypothetical protein